MEIVVFVVGPIATNCYILHNEKTNECLVVDPGEEAKKIAAYIQKNNWTNKGIFLTHGHFDHITGVTELQSLVGGKVYAYEEERDLMMDPSLNSSSMGGYSVAIEPEILLKDGQIINIAGLDIKVIHTPGHTKGGCCFYLEKEKALFSGDTVFMESIGRTDFPTGNYSKLIDSLRNKILCLPSDVNIYPGHGPETTVAYEMANNPYA